MSLPDQSVAAILPAAGMSRRFGTGEKKIFQRLNGRPVWFHAAAALRRCAEVGPIVIAVHAADRDRWEDEFADDLDELRAMLVDGGQERADSVRAALEMVEESPWVAVHDAARPLVLDSDLRRLFETVEHSFAALLASPVRGTIKRQHVSSMQGESPTVSSTVDRSVLWEALTPQVFRTDLLVEAYQRWKGYPVTDDAQLVERAGHRVSLVDGSPTNLKITVADDLLVAAALLKTRSS